MCYNIKDIITAIRALNGKSLVDYEILPYYDGFKGTITRVSDSKYLILGCYDKDKPDTIRITELPVGTWTEDYKKFLETCIEKKLIRDYKDLSTDKLVEFTVIFNKGDLEKLEKKQGDHGCNGLEKLLKLYTTKKLKYVFISMNSLENIDNCAFL